MPSDHFFEIIERSYKEESSFLIYSFPGDQIMTLATGLTPVSVPKQRQRYFTVTGFLRENPSYFEFQDELVEPLPELVNAEMLSYQPNQEGKERYIGIIEAAVQTITAGQLEKVVISRPSEIGLKKFNISKLVKSLFSRYPDTLRYIWYNADTGIWAGATPEILLSTDSGMVETMSLAGTRLRSEILSNPFTEKEVEEQQIVTNMIIETLQNYTSELEVSDSEEKLAGDLVHLNTRISAQMLSGVDAESLASQLHPTPAVCGLPRKESYEYIKTHEGYDRSYYTGYLGILDKEMQTANYFVNLRCMKIKEDVATLYVGGGITGKSNAELEWEETQNKLSTMLKVLAPFL